MQLPEIDGQCQLQYFLMICQELSTVTVKFQQETHAEVICAHAGIMVWTAYLLAQTVTEMTASIVNRNANRKLYVLYQLVLFPVTLSDPDYRKPPISDILYHLSYLRSIDSYAT